MFNLNKTPGVESSEPEVVANRSVDFAKMMDGIAIDTLTEIANCYYSNGSFNEDRADRAIQSIKGRMAAIRQMVASMK